jgi:hypothetical protein
VTKHFCDRCGRDISGQPFIHHVYRDESLNRTDLGIKKPQNKPGLILCDECDLGLDAYLVPIRCTLEVKP